MKREVLRGCDLGFLLALATLFLVGCSDVVPEISILNKGKFHPLVISGPDITLGNQEKEFTWNLTYNKSHTVVLSEDHIQVVTSGSVVCSSKRIIPEGKLIKVTIGGCQGDGEVRFFVAEGSALDALNEKMPPVNSALPAVIDNTPPTVLLLKRTPLSKGNSDSFFEWTATYLGAQEILLNLTKVKLIATSGDPVNCTVTVQPSLLGDHIKIVRASQCQGQGRYKLSIQSASARDQAGNLISISTDSDEVEIDNTKPLITAVAGPSPSQGNSGKVFKWQVTYSGHDFLDLTESGLSLVYSGSVAGCEKRISVLNQNSQEIEISKCSGEGHVQVQIPEGAARDAAGNKTEAKNDLSFATVDNTPPILSIEPVTPTQGNSGTSFFWVVKYSGASAVNLKPTDVILSGDAGVNCSSVSILDPVGVAQRTVKMTGCSGAGNLSISIGPNTALDLAGNLAGSVSSSSFATIDNSVFIGSLTTTTSSVNNLSSIPVTLEFTSIPQTTVSLSDLVLSSNATISGFSGSGMIYNFNLVPSTDGLISVQLKAGVVQNPANTWNQASNKLSFTVDRASPSISIDSPNVNIGNSGTSFSWKVNYSGADAITLSVNDILLNGASSGCSKVVSGTGSSLRTITISGCSGNGPLTFSLQAQTASDDAGNLASTSAVSSAITVDNIAPTLNVAGPTGNQANGYVWMLTPQDSSAVTFHENQIIVSGDQSCQKEVISDSSNRFRVYGCMAATAAVTVKALVGTVQDAAGNKSGIVDIGSFSVDNSVPTLALSAPSAILGNKAKKFEWTLNFSPSAVIQLNSLNLSSYLEMEASSGSHVGCSFEISSGVGINERTVSVSGCSADEAKLRLKVKEGSAKSSSGTTVAPAVVSSHFLTIDNKPPDLRNMTNINISSDGSSFGGTSATTFTWRIHYDSEPGATVNITPGSISVSYTDHTVGAGLSGTQCNSKNVVSSSSVITVTISQCQGDGELTLRLPKGALIDAAGNESLEITEEPLLIVNSTPQIVSIGVGEQHFGLQKPPEFDVRFNIAPQLVLKEEYRIVTWPGNSVQATSNAYFAFNSYNATAGAKYKLRGRVQAGNGVWSSWVDSESEWIASYCPTTTASKYIRVPVTGGGSDFCVAQYEMRKVSTWSDNAISAPSGTPWTLLTRGENNSGEFSGAWGICKKIGAGYNLISNAQWRQIARNIEKNGSNWNSASVNIGNSTAGFVESSEGTKEGTAASKRTHTLSNGEVIWDFAGNVWEWTRDLNSVSQLTGKDSKFDYASALPLIQSTYGPENPSYGISEGMGSALSSDYYYNAKGTARGGSYLSNNDAGIYAIKANLSTSSYSQADVGFRCVFEY